MRAPLALVAVLVLFAAGCAAPPVGPTGGAVGAFKPPVPVSKTLPGGEPVIAVLSDGTLFAEGIGSNGQQNVNEIYKSTDDGATWTVVTPFGPGEIRSNDGFVATGNKDSVYAANVFSTTFQAFRSDDKGATWTQLAMPRVPAFMHRHWIVPSGDSTVFVSVEALPPGFASYLAGQRPPQDVTGTPNEGMWFFKSADKGLTWSTPIQIDPTVNFAGQGNLLVSKDGKSLYVPRYEEASKFAPTYVSGKWYLLASHDAGATWKRTEMFPLTSELSTALTSITMDDAGTLYFVWSQEVGGQSRVEYAFSKDEGKTWSVARAIPGASGTNAMAWARARGTGELDAMWYTADANGTASKVDAPWFVAFANLTGADSDAPIATLANLTSESVHQGNICARGPACSGKEDRRLLDYPWMEYGPDGRIHMIYPSTKWDKPSAFAVYVGEAKRAS